MLKEYLNKNHIECVSQRLPNKIIHELKTFISVNGDVDNFCYYKLDIENFFGTIKHDKLFCMLKEKDNNYKFLRLLSLALTNPTVPVCTKKKDYGKLYNKEGVPQGLSISNILANIYLSDFDLKVSEISKGYFRYVDDIIVFNEADHENCLKGQICSLLGDIGLNKSKTKTECKIENPNFDYLGYHFGNDYISVRGSTVERFINSFVGKFVNFKKVSRFKKKSDKNFKIESFKSIFIEELNEKITGAISEKKKYGWLFYFIEIDDIGLLYKIDNIINGLFARLEDFGGSRPDKLKRLVRAYNEAKFYPESNYIHNYDKYTTISEKLNYLVRFGIVDDEAKHNFLPEEVDKLFMKNKMKNLANLENDLSMLS